MIEDKIKELTGWNKARVFIIVALVIAIIKLERVNLKKLAKVLNPKQSNEANYKKQGQVWDLQFKQIISKKTIKINTISILKTEYKRCKKKLIKAH